MRDYLVIAALDDTRDEARRQLRDRLVADGRWRAVAERPGLSILIEGATPPAYRHLPGVAGGVVGDLFDTGAAVEGRGEDFAVQKLAGMGAGEGARQLVAHAYGRYLAVFTEGRTVRVLRDPMGALEAVSWRRDGLGFIGSRLPADRDLWPVGLGVDWRAIAQILRQKNLASHLSPLTGVASIVPGVLTRPWSDETGERLWSPAWYAAAAHRRLADPQRLERIIDGVTAAYALGRERIVCEISGGLDSSIVAASLKRCGAPVDYGLNHSWPQAEADERRFAQAVADDLGARLQIVDRELLVLDGDKLSGAAGGPRPNYVGGDPDHDADIAARLAGDPPAALFTGRGGDAVFFQMAVPELARDLLGTRPPGIGRVRGLGQLALRRGTTVWRLLAAAREPLPPGLPDPHPSPLFAQDLAAATPAWHPWLSDLAAVSPAKRVQLRAITNNLSAFGESLRHRAGDVLDPLLAQPVVEACLLVPAPMLALGRTDRPFARRAFSRRLPADVLTRQGKGDLSVFFARSLAASLPFLKPYLIDGRLAAQGLLDRQALEEALDPDFLIWRDSTPDLFVALALEAWVRCWEARLAEPRLAEAAA